MRFVLLWAALLAGLALMLTIWWQDAIANTLFWAAVAATLLLALLAWRPSERERVVPDVSLSTMILALGIAGLVAGTAFGDWQVYLAGGIALVGLAGVVRELALQRRRR